MVRHGLHGKKVHASKQIGEGEGYTVDVADQAAFKHYVFVNAEEYGLFDHPQRRFLQTVVCYQVLSTAWNSSTKHDPSSLKPRYLFLFSDAVFVMKIHDVTDGNTRRYRILGHLSLRDLSVEEVGDEMFDLVARGTGAMRFSVGSSLAKTQAVAAFRHAIRIRQGRDRAAEPPSGAPTNPDDVYATMNFALSVLEKKMRGKATEEEQWQVDALLAHALEMQERLHGALGTPTSLPVESGRGATSTAAVASRPSARGASAVASLQSQLQAKEAQLRAMEERAAAAEAAVSRLRGSNVAAADANNSENRNWTLENRTLRMDADRLRAQLEERDKQLAAMRDELSSLKKATRSDQNVDVPYHEGSVDDILTRIQRGPSASSGAPRQAAAFADDSAARETADRRARERAEEDRRADEQRRQQKEAAERREREEAARRADSERREREAEAERKREKEDEAERKFKQLQEAKKKVDQQQASMIDNSLDQFLGKPAASAPVAAKKAPVEESEDDSSDQEVAVTRPKAAVVAAAAKAAAAARGEGGNSSEPLSSDSDEEGLFSTSLSESADVEGDELRSFLSQHDLGHVRRQLEGKTTMRALRAMDLASVRGLGLSYADSSNLATALGIKVVH